jgi:hypothetical protein
LEEFGECPANAGVIGVNGEGFTGEALDQTLDDLGGTAYGVFVEVEAQIGGAIAGGRVVRGHFPDGFAGVKRHCCGPLIVLVSRKGAKELHAKSAKLD